MNKLCKKIIGITALAAVALSSAICPVSAKIVTSQKTNGTVNPNFPDLENVVLYQDYESGYNSLAPIALNGATATIVAENNENMGMVRKIDNAKDAKLTVGDEQKDITQASIPIGDSTAFNAQQDKGRIMLDFDVMLEDKSQNYIIMMRDTEGVDFGWLMFDYNGKVLVDKDGYAPAMRTGKNYTNDSVLGGTYTPKTWNHITIVATPNGVDSTIDFYMDGKYMATSTVDFWKNYNGEQKDKITGVLNRFFICTGLTFTNPDSDTADKSETAAISIDNVCVSYSDQYDSFYASEPVAENGKISVDFNETLASDNNFDGIKIIGLDGVEKQKSSVSVFGSSLTITMKDALEGDKPYAIVVPTDFISVTGHKLVDSAITFDVPNDFNTIFEQGFDSMSDGANTTPIGFFADTKMFGGNFNVVTDPDSSKDGKALYINGTSGQYFRWFGISDPKTPDQKQGVYQYYGAPEYVTASMDFYFDELSHTANMYVLGLNQKRFADAYFDGKGNFVVKKDLNAPNYYDKNAYEYDLTRCYVYNGIKPQKWYTVKAVTNCVDKTVSWYLDYDGEDHFVAKNNYLMDGEGFREIMLDAKTVNGTAKNAGSFYMDNVKIENSNTINTKADLVKQTGADVAVDFTSNSANVPDEYVLSFDVKSDKLRPVTDGTANNDTSSPTYYISSEGRYDSKNTPDDTTDDATPALWLQMNENGQLVMENSFNSFWSNADKVVCPAVESAKDGEFNIKLYVNKSATKNVSIYVDDVLVRRIGLGWGVDNNTYTYAQFPYDGKAVSNGYHKLTKIGIQKPTENTKISNARIGLVNVNEPSNITVTDMLGKTYNIQSNMIPGNVKTIAVKYKNALGDDTTFSGCKLADNSGAEVENITKSYTGDTLTLTIPDGTYLENSKAYNLTLNGISNASDYATTFSINDTGVLSATDLKLYKGESELGESAVSKSDVISAGCTMSNPTGAEKTALLIIAEYDAEQKLMKNIEYQTITVAPYATVTIDTTNNTETRITASDNNLTYKAYVVTGFNSLIPLTGFVQNR